MFLVISPHPRSTAARILHLKYQQLDRRNFPNHQPNRSPPSGQPTLRPTIPDSPPIIIVIDLETSC